MSMRSEIIRPGIGTGCISPPAHGRYHSPWDPFVAEGLRGAIIDRLVSTRRSNSSGVAFSLEEKVCDMNLNISGVFVQDGNEFRFEISELNGGELDHRIENIPIGLLLKSNDDLYWKSLWYTNGKSLAAVSFKDLAPPLDYELLIGEEVLNVLSPNFK